MVVGEAQVLSQVKQAYEVACEIGSTGPVMHGFFQAALRVARRVASETPLHRHRVSVPSVAIADFAASIFERFDDKQVLVIGAGDMAQETLNYLSDAGAKHITVLNRDFARAEALAAEWRGQAAPWNELNGQLVAADLVYAGMQMSGDLLPGTLIPDIPTRFPGFSPKNFDKSFNGAVPAGLALSQSLNIPAVKMLQKYSHGNFLELLKKTGFTTFDKPADYYGLSLILGGGETSLWELAGTYASLSRVLNRYNNEKKYYTDDYHPPVLVVNHENLYGKQETQDPALSASSIWLTYEALQKVNRPESETGWQYFNSSLNIAWKTGTSFGFRDAWAVGTTPDYVIGVWAGNADGEGRPGLTGISAAAPIMFDLAGLVESGKWFAMPEEDLTMIRVCSQSGFRAGPDCPETEEIAACANGLRTEVCPWHRIVHLNKSMTMQVTTDCASQSEIVNMSWFVLPPAMEYFYRLKHSGYKPLPPVAPGCNGIKGIEVMEFIYPTQGIKIFIPRDQTGQLTRVISEVAHRNPTKKIFWHLDEKYIATTSFIHQIEIDASAGSHVLTAVDEDGNSIRCGFSIMI
jgi:penicillin-binding protein 1C